MDVLFLLLLVSFCVALVFLIAFLTAVKRGAFDDLKSPPVRMLQDEPPIKLASESDSKSKSSLLKKSFF